MRRIKCQDRSGAIVYVNESKEHIRTASLESRRDFSEGARSFALDNGEPLILRSDTEFETVAGEILTRMA